MRKGCWILLCALLLTGCGGSGSNYYEEGAALLEQGNYEEAAESFNQAINAEERLPESYRGLGISQLKLGDEAAAIAAFSRSLNELENTNVEFETDVMYYLAQARKDYGEYEEAAEVYTDMLKLKEDPDVYFQRGRVYLELGEDDKAAADFDAATEDSRDYTMYLNIWEEYQSRDRDMDGEAYLEKALEIKPREAADYGMRGRVYYEMKDYDSARQELTQAINDGDDESVLMLGKVYLAMEDAASARSMYQEYLKEGGNEAKAYNGLALCDIYEENYDDALANIEKGLDADDGEEEQSLLFNEIVVYEYKLDFETAKTKMAEYLEKYPDDQQALRENEFLSSR
ncbi:MAG: tetratricopeptide repeat protein [Ruminococcus sp.]|jgi:tetratricopeptide (TPR) repeat protein